MHPSTASAIYVAAGSQSGVANVVRADIRGNVVPSGTAADVMPTFLPYDKLAAAASCLVVATISLTPTQYLQVAKPSGSASAHPDCMFTPGPIRLPERLNKASGAFRWLVEYRVAGDCAPSSSTHGTIN